MIVQIRATSGSGKSTVVRKIIDNCELQPIHVDREKIPHHYICTPEEMPWSYLVSSNKFTLVGPYQAPSGGLDVLGKEERRLANLFEFYRDTEGNILSEGIMQSEDVKWTTKIAEHHTVKIVYLTTPIDLCIARIKYRRLAAGNEKPFNEENTRNRKRVIERALNRLSSVDNVEIFRCKSQIAPKLICSWL